MRVLVEVVGRPLNLRGPQYGVGERLFLESANPQHSEAIEKGWVRRLGVEPPPAVAVALDRPPVDKMIATAPHKGAVRTREKGKGS